MFKLIKTEGKARRGEFTCPHGTVQTPVFMNVGTQAAIKGALSAEDLEHIGTQVELSNTYHLHLRPGDETVKAMGGLHKFMTWNGPILTDSGGFQVFSLAQLRKIKEEGVHFRSHLDGSKMFIGPETSMAIQEALGSDIAMAFDVCSPYPCDHKTAQEAMLRTHRWAQRCKDYHMLHTLSSTFPVIFPLWTQMMLQAMYRSLQVRKQTSSLVPCMMIQLLTTAESQ